VLQKSKRTELQLNCEEELFRQEVENADDIRLDLKLFRACRGDQQRYCKDIAYGSSRVKDCLEEHLKDSKFSVECKTEFVAMMERRAGDFRLDAELRESCADDINKVCAYQEEGKERTESEDAKVITCLVNSKDDLQGKACKAAVHKVIQRQSSDIRMDQPLAAACDEDRALLCGGHMPGSASVIRCLQDKRQELNSKCSAQLFDLEKRLAEDIDFQFPLKTICASELKTLCTKVKKGSARVIRCLHRNVDSRDMSDDCRKEVRRSMNRMSQDYRLNFRLAKSCKDEVEGPDAACKGICKGPVEQTCGGTTLQCLQDNIEKLKSDECKEEVFYFMKMEVSDFRNDVMLAEACKLDVVKWCQDVEPGEGRVIECLRNNRCVLSSASAVHNHACQPVPMCSLLQR
jgi:golgi apparatus protein 1